MIKNHLIHPPHSHSLPHVDGIYSPPKSSYICPGSHHICSAILYATRHVQSRYDCCYSSLTDTFIIIIIIIIIINAAMRFCALVVLLNTGDESIAVGLTL